MNTVLSVTYKKAKHSELKISIKFFFGTSQNLVSFFENDYSNPNYSQILNLTIREGS